MVRLTYMFLFFSSGIFYLNESNLSRVWCKLVPCLAFHWIFLQFAKNNGGNGEKKATSGVLYLLIVSCTFHVLIYIVYQCNRLMKLCGNGDKWSDHLFGLLLSLRFKKKASLRAKLYSLVGRVSEKETHFKKWRP